LKLAAESEGQKTAQREIATSLESALDAPRQRIIVSGPMSATMARKRARRPSWERV